MKGHWFRDGLGEVTGGLTFFLLGAYFALVEFMGEDSLVGGLLQAGFILVFLGLFYFGRRIILYLKTKYVVPRAGFVEYRVDMQHQIGKRIWAAVFAALIAAFAILALPATGELNWLVVLTGLLAGIFLIFTQFRAGGPRRFYVLSALSLLLGIGLGLTELPDGYALGIFYSALGFAFLITGLLVWQSFQRDHPIQSELADEK